MSESKAGRFDRMERTEWIDMRNIHRRKVLVAGAGALGNEVLKCLVLAGFREITVADPDVIEESNLSRCVLFRSVHIGLGKASVAASSVAEIDPQCTVTAFEGRVQELDLSDFGLAIGCLDNISARLHMNSHAKYYGFPYVDGSTDGFRGKVQVVLGKGPCMECGMNRTHLAELHATFSCSPRGPVKGGRILSSGITTASVIAAMCVREAIKIVCGCERFCIEGICYYDGIAGTAELLGLEIDPRCPNHGDES